MNIDGTTLILIFWFPWLSAGPQKQEHKVDHKGQAIAKANYGFLNSPKKQMKCTQDTILNALL